MARPFANQINEREVEVDISKSKVGSKTGKQSIEADNPKSHREQTVKSVEPAKVNSRQHRSQKTKWTHIGTADSDNPVWSNYNMNCLAQAKLIDVEIFPWNAGVSDNPSL